MTRDDIIRMAREAELGVVLTADESVDGEGGVWLDEDVNYITQIERFAALVAAAERESMTKDGWRRCAVNQRTTQFCGMLEDAVKAEREECAKIAEPKKPRPCACTECYCYNFGDAEEVAQWDADMWTANKIRARGKNEPQ